MAEPRIHRIPIVSLADPRYAPLARLVTFPPSDMRRDDEFFPAIAGFDIGGGSTVDVSFLYSFTRKPCGGFDRHLRTQEMFVPLDGDLCLPLAACREPDNVNEQPKPEDFVGVLVRHGEAVILSANVWHTGGWPLDAQKGVRYIMVLSGHRAGQGPQGFVDYILTTLPEGIAIFPEVLS
jgi:hypothetical protein